MSIQSFVGHGLMTYSEQKLRSFSIVVVVFVVVVVVVVVVAAVVV